MAFAGGLGMALELSGLAQAEGLEAEALLFSESPSRLVVTVPPALRADFETCMAGLPCHFLGRVNAEDRLVIQGTEGHPWIDATLPALKEAWQAPLRDF